MRSRLTRGRRTPGWRLLEIVKNFLQHHEIDRLDQVTVEACFLRLALIFRLAIAADRDEQAIARRRFGGRSARATSKPFMPGNPMSSSTIAA